MLRISVNLCLRVLCLYTKLINNMGVKYAYVKSHAHSMLYLKNKGV